MSHLSPQSPRPRLNLLTPTPDSRLPIPDSRLPTPDSRLPRLNFKSSYNQLTC
ncbi:hypothetical protein [Moorena sp. SIO3I8]|uniref:hypothetical protein n=1 Tax=Moorena sp. SIO3I8 TaxID=2607833 RepID=UPI0013BF5413|nr:hypothetical protein [Moorena sp. SIO3I8]NEO04769.1 hypothetical protein [Moorena sp. SIO3I8]